MYLSSIARSRPLGPCMCGADDCAECRPGAEPDADVLDTLTESVLDELVRDAECVSDAFAGLGGAEWHAIELAYASGDADALFAANDNAIRRHLRDEARQRASSRLEAMRRQAEEDAAEEAYRDRESA